MSSIPVILYSTKEAKDGHAASEKSWSLMNSCGSRVAKKENSISLSGVAGKARRQVEAEKREWRM